MLRVLIALITCLAAAAPAIAQVARISVSTAGVEANGPSGAPSVSADGRYIVVASTATNLVADDTNGASDIFLRDRDTDADATFDEAGAVATTRISLGPGATQADGPSIQPAISADGRYVVFVSTAANLVSGANTASQVYRVDRTTGDIIRVSENTAGAAGDQASTEPAISGSGDAVAFTSSATNLAADAGSAQTHIFLREVSADRTTRLSPRIPAPPPRTSICGPASRPAAHAWRMRPSLPAPPPRARCS